MNKFYISARRLAYPNRLLGQKIGVYPLGMALIVAISAIFAVFVLSPGAVRAEVYHLTPGAAAGDGSQAAPWGSFEAALASGQLTGGDELRLGEGSYGHVVLQRWQFDSPLRIVSASPQAAHLTQLEIERSRNLLIEDLAIWPEQMGGRGPLDRKSVV